MPWGYWMSDEKKYDYTAVNLPSRLLELVDEEVEKSERYSSRADFVKKAIKQELIECRMGGI